LGDDEEDNEQDHQSNYDDELGVHEFTVHHAF
jgi:hypothetical protein